MSAVSIRPEGGSRLRCGDYDLDAVVVELDGGTLDFRFELGQGLGIFWALPAGEGDRLRLAHVDGAAYTVDEPTLCADPFLFHLPATTWRGELGQLGDGSTVIAVTVEAHVEPASYRCEVLRRLASGQEEVRVFAWSSRPVPPAPPVHRPSAVAEADRATAALVDGLIDAFHRWDEPERVAARAAREAEQDRRTVAILTHGGAEPLDAILAAPDDDAPRLAWAQAVGGSRGELVRLQCELAQGRLSLPETIAHRRRVRGLLDSSGADWSGLSDLATEVRFERGFVDAARISADTWLAHGRTIRKRAPLLSALTVSGLRGRDIGGGGEGTARILADIDRLLADPQLRGLAALDLSGAAVEVEDDDHDYVSSLSPEVLPRLIASGLLPTLRGLDIGDVGADGLRALGACDLARLEVLRVGAWGQPYAAWQSLLAPGRLPALRSLWILGTNHPTFPLASLLDALPTSLVELAFQPTRTAQLTQLAAHRVGRQIESLVFRAGSLGNTHLLAALPRLRSLDVFDTYGSLGAELSAESLPTLRELRYFCSPMGSKLDVLRSVMSRFGPQLELLDLRGSNRMSTFGSDGAVRGALAASAAAVAGALLLPGREPVGDSLLHLGRERGLPFWDHVRLAI